MKTKFSYLIIALLTAVSGMAVSTSVRAEAKYTIKFAVLAPEGSTWMNVLHDMDKEVQAKTGGEVAFKIYAGGVAGDESDVLRKIRIGQMSGGGFTGIGLASIVPSVRVLELPLLFKDYDQVDKAAAAVRPDLAKEFENKGFVLLGWAEAGFVNLMTKKPVTSLEDLKGIKMWAWQGDPLVKAMFQAISVVPVELSLPDVLVSLQTSLIDGIYNSPLGAVALQWFTKVKYVTEDPLAYASGGLIVSKKIFDTIPANYQKVLRDISEAKSKELIARTRKENEDAKAALKQNGLQFVSLKPEAKKQLEEVSRKVQQSMVGTLYSKALLDKVYGIVGVK